MSAPGTRPVSRVNRQATFSGRCPPGKPMAGSTPGFLDASIDDWLRALAKCAPHPGASRREIRTFGTLLIAGFRGFLLDLLASHDRARIDRAVDSWLRLIYA